MDNLRKIEELIRQLDAIETPLVQIEIRCIEVVENDFQELGFDWTINNYDLLAGHNSTYDSTTGTLSQKNTDKSAWGLTQAAETSSNRVIRNLTTATGGAATSGNFINKLNIFPALT